MLIEDLMPQCDAVTRVHRVVLGTPGSVYPAVREADFLRAWHESAAVTFLFAARSAGERVAARLRGRQWSEPPAPESMRLAEMPARGEWIVLGEDPPAEIAFGAIGRFWAGETSWLTIEASEFAGFADAGYARIACNFSMRAYGAEHTLVTYECRTQATDPEARRGFLRYWWPLAPFIAVVLHSQLRVVESEAAARAVRVGRPRPR